MQTYTIRSPLAMCACAISASLSILFLVEPVVKDGFTFHVFVAVAVSVGLVSLAVITGVLAHGHGLLSLAGAALAALSLGLSCAIVWEQSGRRAQTQIATTVTVVDAAKERARLTKLRAEADEILTKHRADQARECASGKGKRCDGISYTVRTWEAAREGYDAKLRGVPTPTPDAKTERVGTAAGLLGYDATAAKTWVSLLDPIAVPMLLELAAILCGIVAFGPKSSKSSSVSPIATHSTPSVHDEFSDFSGKQSGKVHDIARKIRNTPEKSDTRPPIVAANDEDTIIVGLKRLGGTASSQRELARVMGICDSEVSKRLASCTRVERVREDNRVVVRIKA